MGGFNFLEIPIHKYQIDYNNKHAQFPCRSTHHPGRNQ